MPISTPNLEELKAKEEQKRLGFSRHAKHKQVKVNLWGEDEHQAPFAEVEDDAACIYCNSLYPQSKPGEIWLRFPIYVNSGVMQNALVFPLNQSFLLMM